MTIATTMILMTRSRTNSNMKGALVFGIELSTTDTKSPTISKYVYGGFEYQL